MAGPCLPAAAAALAPARSKTEDTSELVAESRETASRSRLYPSPREPPAPRPARGPSAAGTDRPARSGRRRPRSGPIGLKSSSEPSEPPDGSEWSPADISRRRGDAPEAAARGGGPPAAGLGLPRALALPAWGQDAHQQQGRALRGWRAERADAAVCECARKPQALVAQAEASGAACSFNIFGVGGCRNGWWDGGAAIRPSHQPAEAEVKAWVRASARLLLRRLVRTLERLGPHSVQPADSPPPPVCKH